MLAALNSTAHASQNRAQIILDPRSANDLREPILALRVQKVEISKSKISDVLLDIDTSLRMASGGKRRFSFGLEYPIQYQRQLARHLDNPTKIPAPKALKDPIIILSRQNISLKELLDELCSLADWNYKLTPIGIMFEVKH